MEVSGQLHTLATLSPGVEAISPQLNMRQAGPQNHSDHFGEEKNLFSYVELNCNTSGVQLMV